MTLPAMGADVAVHGEQLAARRAGVSFCFALQEHRHSPPADEVQVLHEAVVVGLDIALLDEHQAGAREPFALVAEFDLAFGQLRAKPFLMDASPAPRPAADASRLGRIEDPAAEVAVHAARSDHLALHPDFGFHLPIMAFPSQEFQVVCIFSVSANYKITSTVPNILFNP
jgi:hypothetical protein